jgi:hypothetical protein
MLLAFSAEVLWRGAEAAGVADAMTTHRDNLLVGLIPTSTLLANPHKHPMGTMLGHNRVH